LIGVPLLAADFYPVVLFIYAVIFFVTIGLGVLGWSIFAGLLGVRVYEKVKSGWYRRREKTVPSLSPPTQLPPPTPPP